MTRGKMLAGLFVASVGGMVALAEPPSNNCPPVVNQKVTLPQLECKPPVVATGLTIPDIQSSVVIDLPKPKEEAPAPKPAAAPAKNINETKDTPQPPKSHYLNTPPTTLNAPPIAVVDPKPAPDFQPTPSRPPVMIVDGAKSTGLPAATLPTPPAVVGSIPTEKPANTCIATVNLGDGKPRFEVKNGSDVQLKVICTHIDTSAGEQGPEQTSFIRASGKVWFAAPGCEGTCEELRFNQSTGEIILAKNVIVTCKQGKSETTLRSDQMTFKLGSSTSVATTSLPEINTTRFVK